jgi:calcium-dependent protein kinase
MGNACCQERTSEPTDRVELPKPPRPEFTVPGSIDIQYKSSCSFLPLTAPIEKLYRSLTLIEKGDYWSTAFAEEASTGKRYRLKTVTLETAGHRLESIKKEVAIMNKLDHPNISKAKAAFQTNNSAYLLSESGEISLQSHLFTTLSLSEVHAAQVMKQVFSLVAYCHSQNIILLTLSLNSFHLTSKTSLDVRLVDLEGACALEGRKERPGTLKEWLAPETLRRSYDQKCDLWSCGYMLFFLISGESPYLMDESEDLEAKIRSGNVTYSNRRWSGRTKELTALLSRLLSVDPADRPSALECLQDPWIRHFCAEDKYPDMHRVAEQLQLYQPSRQWKRAIETFVLQRVLSEEQLKAKTALFKALDHDSDGFINQSELADALKSVMPADKATFVAVQTLTSLDSNHDGLIDFSEFLLAVTDDKQLLSPEHLNKAFNAIDLNQDGYVTLADLQVHFEAGEEGTWRALLMKIGKRPQDQLKYTEFVTLLNKR